MGAECKNSEIGSIFFALLWKIPYSEADFAISSFPSIFLLCWALARSGFSGIFIMLSHIKISVGSNGKQAISNQILIFLSC